MEDRLSVLSVELQYQEKVYHQAYENHMAMQESFDKDVKELYLVRVSLAEDGTLCSIGVSGDSREGDGESEHH